MEKKINQIKLIFSRKMLVSLIMGFNSGLPLLLTISLLQAWMKDSGIDIGQIGLFSLVGLPYTLKFLWAPILDTYRIPIFGRRRGWLLISQFLLMGSIVGLGMQDPKINPISVAFFALLVSFFSATQDIVIDAYRREDLSDKELGLGSSLYIMGYRIAMLLTSGGGLILADHISFQAVYIIMAACLIPGIFTTVFTPEPQIIGEKPKDLQEAVVKPLVDYFTRVENSILILFFILLYKIGDTMAGAMTTPFYLELGFSKTEIGAIVKLFGFWATILGGFLGGILMLRLGIKKSLISFGILQAVSTFGFSILAIIGYSLPTLTLVIAFENFTSGMGTSAFSAFMASLTNKKFTATQYALLSSLMGIPRVFISAPTGYIAKYLGWINFFILCTLIAIPGILIIYYFKHEENENSENTVLSEESC